VARPKGYFIGLVDERGSRQAVLVEAPPSSIQRLVDQLTLEGEVFGPGVSVFAHRRAVNRPVSFDFDGSAGPKEESLTTVFRALSAAAVLFGLPLPYREEPLPLWVARSEAVARNILLVRKSRGR
jgi:hypothetical protein